MKGSNGRQKAEEYQPERGTGRKIAERYKLEKFA